ncbi:MAG: epoxyqueuosine reductase [Crocinitomicaceae bacterium]|nr:epoxyqueuosine reductase [Crocinitomicaceae bacterium]
MSVIGKHTAIVKKIAAELGFLYCGISKAAFLEEDAPRLEKWLHNGFHGKMSYMENYFDKRLDPRLLVEGSKSVVSLVLNYYPESIQKPDVPQVSKYAYGNDYHEVIKDKLKLFLEKIREQIGDVGGRVFVDSAPVMDKSWARKSGLGWTGKNGNLIHPKNGSFFFIAELIIDLELEPDGPIKDYCGTCTRCVDACPTDALNTPYIVDGSKCISYLTIELKDELIPQEFAGKMNNWAFGCDICQDVCPWNRFSRPTRETAFQPNELLLSLTANDWQDLEEDQFSVLAKNSPIKRTKLKGMKRNVLFSSKPE